jgi:hypothetical protein
MLMEPERRAPPVVAADLVRVFIDPAAMTRKVLDDLLSEADRFEVGTNELEELAHAFCAGALQAGGAWSDIEAFWSFWDLPEPWASA